MTSWGVSALLLGMLLSSPQKLAAAKQVQALKFVLTPYRTVDDMRARYTPLADRLQARIGRPVELLVAESFGAAADMLVDGRADIGELTPYAFVSGMEKGHLLPIVADAMLGRPGTGFILVLAGSPIQTVQQLSDARFGFVDEYSSTGYLGPWATLQNKGVSPASSRWKFLGSHNAVLDALIAGTIDAGAVSRHLFETYLSDRKIDAKRFRVLLETARMPADVICGRRDLPEDLEEKIQAELLGLSWDDPAGRAILDPMNRKAYAKVDVREYAWLLRVAASIHQK